MAGGRYTGEPESQEDFVFPHSPTDPAATEEETFFRTQCLSQTFLNLSRMINQAELADGDR